MPAVGHLHRLGSGLSGRQCIATRPVTAYNLYPRMGFEPCLEGLRFPIRQQVNDLVLFQVN